ncbi:MAG TPA: TraR/DksA family transcriptional regulator [Actinomycetota bacterium]|nr:TraR/DksA family transcriptional regulator [Actinomycetota bacterium]
MDEQRARTLLQAERAKVEQLLGQRVAASELDLATAKETGDWGDRADPLTDEQVDEALVERLQARLAAIERAEKRLEEGTYGRSVQSGDPIPDERLEADPAAELTVDEARQA